MLVPKPIVGKILRGEVNLVFRLATTRRPRVGERLYIKARQKDEVACHVLVAFVGERLLGPLTFEDARSSGYRTTVDAKTAWIQEHDLAWLNRQMELDLPYPDDGEMVARFDQRWAPKRVHVITFTLDTSEQPIMLMQGSPLTDGGKARLMSNRKLPPGRATSTAITGPEEHGYTASGPRAMPREAEPVDAATQKRYAMEKTQGFIAREAQRQADRERLGLVEHLALALSEGRDGRVEESIRKRIRALESKNRRRT